jgi:hypothetical protein
MSVDSKNPYTKTIGALKKGFFTSHGALSLRPVGPTPRREVTESI